MFPTICRNLTNKVKEEIETILYMRSGYTLKCTEEIERSNSNTFEIIYEDQGKTKSVLNQTNTEILTEVHQKFVQE